MNLRWPALLAAAVVTLCQVATAQDATPAQPPADPADETIQQVEVEAKRARLKALEVQLNALEDKFFEQYNQLNDISTYKVNCGYEMRQHFRVHQCRPVFQEQAEREGVNLAHTGSTGGLTWDPNLVALRTREYQLHMIDLVKKNPALLEVLKERAELDARFKSLKKELLADKTFVME